MSDYKNEGGLIWKDMASPGCHIYIHGFVCDLTKGADACYTQENLGKHTRELTAERERERERPLMLDYHIYINLCGSVGLGWAEASSVRLLVSSCVR